MSRVFFVGALVALLATGCAKNGGNANDCGMTTLAPSCASSSTGATAPALRTTVPTPMEVVAFDGVSSPVKIQLKALSMTPSVSPAGYRFSWQVTLAMDNVRWQYDNATFEIYPSNDGVNPTGDAVGSGHVIQGVTADFPNGGSAGQIQMMQSTFPYLIAKVIWSETGFGNHVTYVSWPAY